MEAEVLADTLGRLSGLTALEIIHLESSNLVRVLDCILSLSKLKALTFKSFQLFAEQIDSTPLTSRMQLTKLSWSFNISLLQMMHLTEVKHFEILIGDEDSLEDLVRSLRSMTDLQYLSITRWGTEPLALGNLLAGMTRLRQLEVDGKVDADPAMYQTLATFPELTGLCLQYRSELSVSDSFHSQINLLTNLRSLAIHFTGSPKHGLLDSLSGENLKRLQRLNVYSAHLNLDGRAALFRRLPSLRSFSRDRIEYLSDW